MKYSAVIDTNVIVSALLNKDSVPGNILKYVFEGKIIPLVCQEILDEYYKVLKYDKFSFSSDAIEGYMHEIKVRSLEIDPVQVDLKFADPSDKIFYEVLMSKQKDEEAYLITGNLKHFPHKFYVVSPRQMLEIIMQDLELSNLLGSRKRG